MQPKNLICVVVDRLHAGMVGAYGNSWIHTRGLDRLACESFLFDQAIIDSPQLAALYGAYWFAARAALVNKQPVGGSSFPQILSASGMHTALVTDEVEVAGLPTSAHFAERILVETPRENRTASDLSTTQLAVLFETAGRWLEAPRQPFCLWIHARGMAGAWDAPWECRASYADEEDPEPPRFADVPNYRLSDDYDVDELLGITHAYAGQISVLDLCVGSFCDSLAESAVGATAQLTFLSARGFPLGEHLRVGPCDEALYNETVQVPWLMRFPDGLGRLARSQALVQPADLPGTLLDWLGLDRRGLGSGHASSLIPIIAGQSESIRDRSLLESLHDRAIRTPAWHLRQPAGGAAELYAKPDDRWEVNEVADRMPEIVSGLQAAMAEIEQSGEAGVLSPLADSLVTEID